MRLQIGRCVLAVLAMLGALLPLSLNAQIEPPDRKQIFRESREREIEKRRKAVQEMTRSDRTGSDDVDFQAPTVEFLQERNVVKGSGGVVAAQSGVQVQADLGEVNTQSKDGTFAGNVLVTSDDFQIGAESGAFNFDTERGTFDTATIRMENGSYYGRAAKIEKLSEREYKLFDNSLSTCDCPEGTTSWLLRSERLDINQDGFATARHATLRFGRVPVFYTPYISFPINQDRASGFLTGSFGYDSDNGFQVRQPFFWAIDESSDLLITPFIETKSRNGVMLDYRQVLSRQSKVRGGLVYSNERPRDGDLQGTKINGFDDPGIDDDRFAFYLNQSYRSAGRSENRFSAVTDVNYVSDDLTLLELDLPEIGGPGRKYTTSRALLRGTLGEYVSAELSGEYNQALRDDDDTVLQRLPELSVDAQRSFRPFGVNPYGIKVVPALNVNAVRFDRDEGFDGTRYDATPSVTVPFRYRNWFTSALAVKGRFTQYSLSETEGSSGDDDLDSSSDRQLFNLSLATRSSIERVFEVEQDGWFTNLTSLGIRNQGNRLRRLKHVIEPTVQFTWIPPSNQEDLPLFDDVDRVRSRAQFRYGVRTALLGRFSPLRPGGDTIPELAPEIEDLPTIDIAQPVTSMFDDEVPTFNGAFSLRKGEIRELAELSLSQTYNFNPDDSDPGQRLSDLGAELAFTPNRNFGLGFDTNYDVRYGEVSSWGVRTQFDTDRGDSLRARYSFIDSEVSQIEGNVEVVLLDQLRAGYYGRFDDRDSEFIENRVGLRFLGDCDCWHVDLGFQNKSNPDKNLVLLSVTLQGLGDIVQKFSAGGSSQ